MILRDKLEFFKNKGYSFNSDTGYIISYTGNKINAKNSMGYIVITTRSNKKTISIYAHQLAWYLYYNEVPNVIDHIDRNKENNKIENLRNVNQQINQWNRSNVKGYCKKNDKYISYIYINSKMITLGTFDTESDAKKAHLDAKKIYHS
jgi:hypothetical protein